MLLNQWSSRFLQGLLMLQLQEKHPVMVDLRWSRREIRGGTMSNWLGLWKFWGVYCCHCRRGFSVIKYMSMSVETLEKTKPWSIKMKSSPKMIRSMSWIGKSMSWIGKSWSTKSWKRGRRPCKILTPLKRLHRIHNRYLLKSMERFQPGELVTKAFLSLRLISPICFF